MAGGGSQPWGILESPAMLFKITVPKTSRATESKYLRMGLEFFCFVFL